MDHLVNSKSCKNFVKSRTATANQLHCHKFHNQSILVNL